LYEEESVPVTSDVPFIFMTWRVFRDVSNSAEDLRLREASYVHASHFHGIVLFLPRTGSQVERIKRPEDDLRDSLFGVPSPRLSCRFNKGEVVVLN
jgi:hypothetical protein